jgi:rhamnosyltransferase
MTAAIIVLYNPDLPSIERLLECLTNEVEEVIVVDNTPIPATEVGIAIDRVSSKVSYISFGKNAGIAAAQNAGINLAASKGHSHIILLDQDSEILPGTVEKLLAAEQELRRSGVQIAAICPRVIDRRTGNRPAAVRYHSLIASEIRPDASCEKPIHSENLIASGSLIRIDTIKTIGFMREDLFIEYVDTEWVLRALSAGYYSYCVPDARMMHSLGDSSVKIFDKNIYLYTNDRYYYKLRNEVYLARLRTMGWQWRMYALSRIPYHYVLYSAISKNRLRASLRLLKAIRDGIVGRLGPLPA